jgi:hypothetical protein
VRLNKYPAEQTFEELLAYWKERGYTEKVEEDADTVTMRVPK